MMSMNNEKMFEICKKHYSNPKVLNAILPFLKDREVVMFTPDYRYFFRALKCNNVGELQALFGRYSFCKNKDCLMNLYGSLAILDMPYLSFNREEKIEQQKRFNIEYPKLVKGIDFGLDFDAKEHTFDEVKEDAFRVVDLFQTYGMNNFLLKVSGSGMHIDIPYSSNFLKDGIHNFQELLMFYGDFCVMLKDILGLKTIDMKVYDARRCWKTPFSIDVKTGNIVLPINHNEVLDITYDYVNAENFNEEKLDKAIAVVNLSKSFVNKRDIMGIWERLMEKKWGEC